jgi:pimeloyl-ACP methyl ester carboxylesterase
MIASLLLAAAFHASSLLPAAARPSPLMLAAAIHPLPSVPWRRGGVSAVAQASAPQGPATFVVGSQTLHRCKLVVAGYCGRLTVPLNWLDLSDGTIEVRYEFIPAHDGRSAHTIVAQEGGPGYASTGTGDEYYPLFKPLLGDHNLLMMDERGTGASTPIDCTPLQAYIASYALDAYKRVVAQCADQLNHTFPAAHGGFVHASDLFGTSDSVRDLAAILAALGQSPVDLYGDSYGSFFAQVFASRYPHLLRSVVLDSTYPTLHQDPFDTVGEDRVRFAFEQTCVRSLACSAVVRGSSNHLLHRLALRLQQQPLRAETTTPAGRRATVDAGAPELETLMTAGGYDTGAYRNLDAAALALLQRNDAVPLARLFEWTFHGPAFYPLYGYKEYSAGMGLADQCTVYTNPFSLQVPFAERRVEYAQAVAALSPLFAYPVPNADALRAPDEGYDECITWPKIVHDDPIVTKTPPIVPRDVPVLILSGDIDTVTSHGDAEIAAHQLGSSVTFVDVPNQIHTPALDDPYGCASQIVLQFVSAPSSPLDTSCTAAIPEVRTLGVFPTTLADMPPATALSGNTASVAELRLAALAVNALGDSLLGAGYVYSLSPPNCSAGYCGVGMRGGRYAASPDLRRIALDRIAYSRDTTVSGGAQVSGAIFPTAPGSVTAQVRARGPGGLAIEIEASWNERLPRALVTLSGKTASGNAIQATLPAPT